MNFQRGTSQYLRAIWCFKPVKICPRCNRPVSLWHEHWTKPGRPVSATRAYDKAAREFHGAFATMNFPEEA